MVLLLLNSCSRSPALLSVWARVAILLWLRKSIIFWVPRCRDRGIDVGIVNCSRVAICDFRGTSLLDCYVVPTMPVTDYRTSTTGITPAHLGPGKSTTDTESHLVPSSSNRH
jgi:hypothetical protein